MASHSERTACSHDSAGLHGEAVATGQGLCHGSAPSSSELPAKLSRIRTVRLKRSLWHGSCSANTASWEPVAWVPACRSWFQ
eukprot:860090-Amphidinium_carterae.1